MFILKKKYFGSISRKLLIIQVNVNICGLGFGWLVELVENVQKCPRVPAPLHFISSLNVES